MNQAKNLNEIESFIDDHTLALVYISRENCTVCHALLPKVKDLLKKYPAVQSIHVDAEEVQEIAGRFSIFTVPVIILFAEGKEVLRKARFVSMDELDSSIGKIYEMVIEN